MATLQAAEGSIVASFRTIPPIFDPKRAENTFLDLRKAADRLECQEADQLRACLDHETGSKILEALFSNSTYLSRTALRFPTLLPELLFNNADQVLEETLAHVQDQARGAESKDALMKAFRVAKAKTALLAALADITQVWGLFEVTGSLTKLADACLHSSFNYLLFDAEKEGKVDLRGSDDPAQDSGFAIIAMGKYGAGELNYSSDIDIIVFYEMDKLPVCEGVEPKQFCVRQTKEIVRFMQDITVDGYVFRTDLRLRPDAGATAIAMPMQAAEQYYESMGQNWERAAMIKARACAGDVKAGKAFLKHLEPFIWRKYLDYAAIEDIHSIKRQIHSHGKHKAIAVAGHNIKLGLGGIREIEFFVQTQQLIMGGRNIRLRSDKTCQSLSDLAAEGMIEQETADEMTESYKFLRHVEHRLQMKDDAQTHTMPNDPEAIDNIARFSGFEETANFEDVLLSHLHRVNKHYIALFAQEEALSGAEGSLVFTGVDDDPETLETLQSLGFERPSDVAATVRAWHHGRIRATRSERSRELLTKLIPGLLEAISGTADPDTTFARFGDFLKGLPSGVQLFSLFYSHAELLYMLVDALGTAPRLGPYLASNPTVIDALLDPDFLESLPTEEDLAEELSWQLSNAQDYESALNIARRWGKDHGFRIGIQVLRGTASSVVAGPAYTNLAETIVKALAPLAKSEIENAHGEVEGSGYAVLGMGKMGGAELTATSDLDLVIIYDVPEDVTASNGAKSIDTSRYFVRFTQRLISALSALTAEGMLYEVDMQLRPSGKNGPVATRFATFDRYYEDDAWTWEKMALTRARIITGSESLIERVNETINRVLTTERDRSEVVKDILDMRARLEKEKGTKDPWSIKQVRGGIIDLEFICQFLQLIHGAKLPPILHQNTATAFQKMIEADVLDASVGERLILATRLLSTITQVTRIAVAGTFKPEEAGESLRILIAQSVGVKTFEEVDKLLLETEAFVHKSFDEIIRA